MALDIDEVLSSWGTLLDAGATTIYPAHGSVITADELRPVLERHRRPPRSPADSSPAARLELADRRRHSDPAQHLRLSACHTLPRGDRA